jgi:hypothetical protein
MTRVRKWKVSLVSDPRVTPNSPSWRGGAIAVSQTSHAHLLNIATVCCVLGCAYRTVVYNIQVTSLIARLRAYDTAVARNVFVNATFGSLASDPKNNFRIGPETCPAHFSPSSPNIAMTSILSMSRCAPTAI